MTQRETPLNIYEKALLVMGGILVGLFAVLFLARMSAEHPVISDHLTCAQYKQVTRYVPAGKGILIPITQEECVAYERTTN